MSNLGRFDRIARLVVGFALIVVSLIVGSSIGTTLAVVGIGIGAVLSGTAFIGSCPIYALFGLSSKRTGAYRGQL